MEHSITSLAKQARITVRTLRHYDEIGLLKPSIRMANGKRVYSDEEFMHLFEIVFFKKIGVSLPKIKEIFRSKNRNKAAAATLTARRQALAKEIKKLQRHITTLDLVLPQYVNSTLSEQERLEKFRSCQHLIKELEEIQIKEFGKKEFERIKEKVEGLSDDEVDEVTDRSNKLMKVLVKTVERGLDPGSTEAQEIIQQYYDLTAEFQTVTKEIFLKHQEFVLDQKECYAVYHPKLPEFLYEAMGIFAARFFKE